MTLLEPPLPPESAVEPPLLEPLEPELPPADVTSVEPDASSSPPQLITLLDSKIEPNKDEYAEVFMVTSLITDAGQAGPSMGLAGGSVAGAEQRREESLEVGSGLRRRHELGRGHTKRARLALDLLAELFFRSDLELSSPLATDPESAPDLGQR